MARPRLVSDIVGIGVCIVCSTELPYGYHCHACAPDEYVSWVYKRELKILGRVPKGFRS